MVRTKRVAVEDVEDARDRDEDVVLGDRPARPRRGVKPLAAGRDGPGCGRGSDRGAAGRPCRRRSRRRRAARSGRPVTGPCDWPPCCWSPCCRSRCCRSVCCGRPAAGHPAAGRPAAVTLRRSACCRSRCGRSPCCAVALLPVWPAAGRLAAGRLLPVGWCRSDCCRSDCASSVPPVGASTACSVPGRPARGAFGGSARPSGRLRRARRPR